VPTGGQFAPERRPVSPVNLCEDEAAKAVRHAQRAGCYWAARLGIADQDEVVGRTLEAYLRQGRPNGTRDLGAYVFCLAKGVALQYASRGNRAVQRAWVALAQRLEAEAQATGHWPSATDQERLADEVRLSFPPSRRPPRDFARRGADVGLEAQHDANGVLWASSSPEPGKSLSIEPTAPVDEALAEVDGAVETAARAAVRGRLRSRIWGVLAPGGPEVRPLSASQAAKARRQVATAGGVLAVLGAWAKGEAGENEAEALFAPWMARDDAERQEIAAVLGRYRPYAGDLWGAALRAAVAAGATHA